MLIQFRDGETLEVAAAAGPREKLKQVSRLVRKINEKAAVTAGASEAEQGGDDNDRALEILAVETASLAARLGERDTRSLLSAALLRLSELDASTRHSSTRPVEEKRIREEERLRYEIRRELEDRRAREELLLAEFQRRRETFRKAIEDGAGKHERPGAAPARDGSLRESLGAFLGPDTRTTERLLAGAGFEPGKIRTRRLRALLRTRARAVGTPWLLSSLGTVVPAYQRYEVFQAIEAANRLSRIHRELGKRDGGDPEHIREHLEQIRGVLESDLEL